MHPHVSTLNQYNNWSFDTLYKTAEYEIKVQNIISKWASGLFVSRDHFQFHPVLLVKQNLLVIG